jgi:uncharacterized protein (TIGR02246 family)
LRKGDAKAVAAFWAEDGDYVDVNGRYLQGRSAIKKCVQRFVHGQQGTKDVHQSEFGALRHAGRGH